MVNLEITGRMGVTTEVYSRTRGYNRLIVKFQELTGLIRVHHESDHHIEHPISFTIDELREIVARWDAGV